jgi:hypothetical protein
MQTLRLELDSAAPKELREELEARCMSKSKMQTARLVA